jgi:lactoylglutathione lyase
MAAKIRHIAIATQDPDKIATFFKEALGLQQVGVANSDLATGYFLTDGYINLAILKFKNDYAAYTEGAPRYEGLHHFGFKVDNMEDARKHLEEAGATFQPLGGKATGQGMVDVEVKYYLPNEVRIDLSEKGWFPHHVMTLPVAGSLAGRGLHVWIQHPERCSLEIGRDVFDSVAIAYSILVFSHVADVGDQQRILQQGERMPRW